MILGLVEEAVAAGARRSAACEILGIQPRTLERWRKAGVGDDRRAGPRTTPANKRAADQRARVLEVCNTPEHRDLSPKQIVPLLADQGEYIASESTVYRILREENQLNHRESAQPPSKPHKPDMYVATGPNQVWSWDITYLRSPVRGLYFYLYVVMDIWSRKIVGWTIESEESADHAKALILEVCRREGVCRDQLVIHSDNGSPMRAATLLAFFQILGITPSYSRPSVSNDNPYSESLFRTAKYRPSFPRRPFASIEEARAWMTWFESWYNRSHRHSAIKFVTPEQRHTGQDLAILDRRREVYELARARDPNRWTGPIRDWAPVKTVVLNPNKTVSPRSFGAA